MATAASSGKTLPALGFLTVTHNEEWGFTGGLLVLNAAGRPMEFHCTAPIKPNRAQEILYGPTLHPFLYGEQIGRALLEKVKSETLFLCTDLWPALCIRHETKLPVVLVLDATDGPSPATSRPSSSTNDGAESKTWRVDREHSEPPAAHYRLLEFSLGGRQLAVLAEFETDRQRVLDHWQPDRQQLDLREPFARIREALQEAQRGASQ